MGLDGLRCGHDDVSAVNITHLAPDLLFTGLSFHESYTIAVPVSTREAMDLPRLKRVKAGMP